MQRRNGFSLVELMVVMGIVAIIAAIAVASKRSYIDSAQVSQARNSLDSLLIKSVALYHADGAFTTDVTDLGLTQGANAATTAIPATVDDYIDPYLARVSLSAGAAGAGACAFGVIKGYISGMGTDEYITGNAGDNYFDLEYIIIDVNGKMETLCYTSADATEDLYTDIIVSGCTAMTFGEAPEDQTEAANLISQCP